MCPNWCMSQNRMDQPSDTSIGTSLIKHHHHYHHPCEQCSSGCVPSLLHWEDYYMLQLTTTKTRTRMTNWSDNEIINLWHSSQWPNYLSHLPPPFQHHSNQFKKVTTSSTTSSTSTTLTPSYLHPCLNWCISRNRKMDWS